MIIHIFQRSLKRNALSSLHTWQRANKPGSGQSRLTLELLETRCLLSTVTNLSDHDLGSLRDAIATTLPGGTVDFQPGLSGTITLTSGVLLIDTDLRISGPGADVITVSGNDRSEVLSVSGLSTVEIAGLTIAEGTTFGFGGGIANRGTLTVANSLIRDSFSIRGGGIANFGTLTVIDSILSDNWVDLVGGGIYNPGLGSTATVINSTLSGNSATAGGGIANEGGTLTVTNSTLSGNLAGARGGAIENAGTLATITNSTLSGNSVNAPSGFGAGLSIIGSTTQTVIRNTILGGNHAASSPDVGGPVNSQGHNLIGDGTGASGFADTDVVGTTDFPIDPLLEPLGDYGGPTQTMRPSPGSPVINAGDNIDAPDTDQRGFTRIVGGFIDIGAVELQPDEFGGPSGSSAAPLLLTRLPAERVAVAPTEDASAFTASAAQMESAPADRQRLDAFFAVLGGTREDHGQPEFLPHVVFAQSL
jgi:hypothetical protein